MAIIQEKKKENAFDLLRTLSSRYVAIDNILTQISLMLTELHFNENYVDGTLYEGSPRLRAKISTELAKVQKILKGVVVFNDRFKASHDTSVEEIQKDLQRYQRDVDFFMRGMVNIHNAMDFIWENRFEGESEADNQIILRVFRSIVFQINKTYETMKDLIDTYNKEVPISKRIRCKYKKNVHKFL